MKKLPHEQYRNKFIITMKTLRGRKEQYVVQPTKAKEYLDKMIIVDDYFVAFKIWGSVKCGNTRIDGKPESCGFCGKNWFDKNAIKI